MPRVKITPLDKLVSEFVRRTAIKEAGGCERMAKPTCVKHDKWYTNKNGDNKCLKAYKQIENAHFINRANKMVRYDLANCAGLCYGCHQYLDSHPYEKEAFFKRKLGMKRFNELKAKALNTHPKPDIELIEAQLREKLKGLR